LRLEIALVIDPAAMVFPSAVVIETLSSELIDTLAAAELERESREERLAWRTAPQTEFARRGARELRMRKGSRFS